MVAEAPAPERHGPVAIPPELLTRKQWLARTGKAPERYVSHADAQRRSRERQMDGAGFMVLASDPYTLIDVDHCVTDGRIATIVALWLKRLGSYCEYSTSGTGVHVILRARKHTDCCVFHLEDATLKQRFKVEMYDQGRFVVLTGKAAAGLPAEIAENQAGLDAFIAALEGEKPQRHRGARDGEASSHPPIDDDVAIARARALPGMDGVTFARYFDQGADREHHSEEDFHLFLILGKVTADRDQIERIYRRSALMREKVAARAQYHIGHALEKLAREPGSAQDPPGDGDAGDQERPPVCADGDADEVAALKRQVAAKIAECEQWKTAYASLQALLMTPGLKESEKKALIDHLGRHGCTFGLPMPTVTWFSYLGREDYAGSPVGESSYRDANLDFQLRGLFEKRDHVSGQTGNPYKDWRPVPAAVEAFAASLRAGETPTPTPRQEVERDNRLEKQRAEKEEARARERKERAQEEAHDARLRQEADALRQATYQRDEARREAEERRRALDEAQEVIAVHQRRETLACRGCGTKIDVEQWRCDACRDREREQQQPAERLAANGTGTGTGTGNGTGNGRELLVNVTSLDTYPQVVAGGGLVVNVTNDSACSDCGRSIPTPAIGAGRCASCRQRAYAALGWEDTS